MQKEHQRKILSRLALVRHMTLRDTMELLNVSESTARRLFVRLEEEGLAMRTFGGIQYGGTPVTQYSFDTGAKSNIEKKTAIAREAVRYVENGDIIFCDSGTTIQCFCAELVHRIEEEHLQIQLYTNSRANLEMFSGIIPVTLVGGKYRPNRRDFCGFIADEALAKLYFTKIFIGADGCIDGRAFSTTDMETAHMNQIAIDNCEKAYMMVDSTKFYATSAILYTPIEPLYAIVTDDGIEREMLEKLRKTGVRVVTVACDTPPDPDA